MGIGLALSRPVDNIVESIYESIMTFMTPVWEQYPNLKTVSYGYDFS